MKNLLITFLTVFILSVNTSLAETGTAFLKLGMGARPVGLGGAFTAISNDVIELRISNGKITSYDTRVFFINEGCKSNENIYPSDNTCIINATFNNA